MAFWNKKNDTKKVDEALDIFRGKGDEISAKEKAEQKGEGWESLSMIPGIGNLAIGSFNMFYDQYVNRVNENEFAKIMSYREMAMYPEVADVIEDGTNESTQVDHDDRVINLQILDSSLTTNDNIVRNITNEFNNFFYQQLEDFPEKLWDLYRTYLIDGRVFYERVINEKKLTEGIKSIKKLPSETMDYIYDPATGTILTYFQYLKRGTSRPKSIEEAAKRNDVIVFNPEQIGFVNYGIYGKNKYDILGYLEKCRVPYNQLKLLEISVVIYRLIRSPERFVFRIDTGNMPRDKALKYVEKIKLKMAKKQTYNSTTGQLTMEPEVFCIRKNTEIPLLDGRYLTLKEIIKEHVEGKENWVYSVNQKTLNIESGKIINAAITRKDENLIRIWTDNENYIDTTYDHKYILRNGSECRADELSIGQSLMPLYIKDDKIYNPKTNQYKKFTYEYVKNFIEKNDYKLLSKKYESAHDKLQIQCPIGHIYKVKFNNFQQGQRCRLCSFEKNANKQRHSYDYIKSKFEKYDYELLSSEYKNASENLKVKCPCGHEYDVKYLNFYKGRRCPVCNINNQKLSYNFVCNQFTKEGYTLLSEKYKNHKIKMLVKCPHDHEYNVRYGDFKYVGNRCPHCSRVTSKQEKEILNYVKILLPNEKIIENDRTQILNPITNRYLELDIWIPTLNKAIEFNGKHWHDNKYSKIKDGIKIKQCKEKNINLLVLWYEDWKDNKELLLEKVDNFLIATEETLNHKIAKIEYLNETDDTGCIEVEGNHNFAVSRNSKPLIFIKNSMLENFYLPQSSEGRGSQIDTLGGDASGFAELDDLYYFARKLYRALKYPQSRVEAANQGQSGDNVFGGSTTQEIPRDEIKWAKFLERQQTKFELEMTRLFLIHLEFKGLKREYGLSTKKIRCVLVPPSNYKEQMEQAFLESRYNNYQALADRPEISKYYLMKKFLKWSEDDIQENVNGLKKDQKFGFIEDEAAAGGGGGFSDRRLKENIEII